MILLVPDEEVNSTTTVFHPSIITESYQVYRPYSRHRHTFSLAYDFQDEKNLFKVYILTVLTMV